MADDSGILPVLAELKKLKVVQLKSLLSENGLPISGLKADLIERLHNYSQQIQGNSVGPPETDVIQQDDEMVQAEDTEEEESPEESDGNQENSAEVLKIQTQPEITPVGIEVSDVRTQSVEASRTEEEQVTQPAAEQPAMDVVTTEPVITETSPREEQLTTTEQSSPFDTGQETVEVQQTMEEDIIHHEADEQKIDIPEHTHEQLSEPTVPSESEVSQPVSEHAQIDNAQQARNEQVGFQHVEEYKDGEQENVHEPMEEETETEREQISYQKQSEPVDARQEEERVQPQAVEAPVPSEMVQTVSPSLPVGHVPPLVMQGPPPSQIHIPPPPPPIHQPMPFHQSPPPYAQQLGSVHQPPQIDQHSTSPHLHMPPHPLPQRTPPRPPQLPEKIHSPLQQPVSIPPPVHSPLQKVEVTQHFSPMDQRNGPPLPEETVPKPSPVQEMEPVTNTEEVKGKKKRKKKKKKKKRPQQERQEYVEYMDDEDDVEIEYVPEQLGIDPSDPNFSAFSKIFEAFKLTDTKDNKEDKKSDKKEESSTSKQPEIKDHTIEEEEDEGSDVEEEKKEEDDKPKLSKKKLRKMNRLSVAELKQLVQRPDVVEMHDVTALDPKLLVYLKAYRNTVPVPRHWCFKRKYLQGKRGVEKPPFDLPEFIKKTGVMEMRAAMQEKEDQKTMKSKMREKVRPKMGKIDIDYQKLHDAFFKWQTKPKMTIHGDLYYEGKEYETKLKEKKPGDLSDDLRTALGMPTGPNKQLVPPPWLIAMQRYGPPPSYPNLKIPGLNAPIPEGASFGYHAGGWGKPPVDQLGQPLYGDVFGMQQEVINVVEDDDQIDRAPWGELESESESEEEESESEEEGPDQTGLMTPAETGLITPSGLSSVPAGMETPDMIELRKRKNIEEEMEMGDQPSLYTVIPEKKTSVGAAMMGSAHIYDIAQVQGGPPRKVVGDGVEVALDPSELELDPVAMQVRYEQQMRERENQLQKEDLSDMVAEHAAKQKKRKKATDSGKAAKKYKEFKF